MASQTTISPHNQLPLLTRCYPSEAELDVIIENSAKAQRAWSQVPLKERIDIGQRFIVEFEKMRHEIPMELTLQMGRPIAQVESEIRGFIARADYMLSVAASSLQDVVVEDTDPPRFKRFIKRVPLGVVLVIIPWNYPYLAAANSVIPALIAGNSVLFKPSPQTPLTAERIVLALARAGAPKDVVQVLHLSTSLAIHTVQHPLVNFVSFTGSVANGRAVGETVAHAKGFKGVSLELGGKDPAYVRSDADLSYTISELVDGAFFNSGQSCCGVERIYVHESIFDEFVDLFTSLVKQYKLGDPTQSETSLGPVVSVASAEKIRGQISDALAAGAKALIPAEHFPMAQPGTAYVAPQVLIDVNHDMSVMMEETFGPVIGIQKVSSDEEALHLMNDSSYGLSASIWTDVEGSAKSKAAFLWLVDGLETGTVYLNRCDYLDPALAWTGVKDSGRGVSLSKYGYDQLTRTKSVHMKIKTS